MRRKLMCMAGAGLAFGSLLLSGCGDMKARQLWPFGGDTAQVRARTPVNATEYLCAAGKRFHVRTLEDGAAVWLILPERELRLEKIGAESGLRYARGNTVLDLGSNGAMLKDGAVVSFAGCKTSSSEPK